MVWFNPVPIFSTLEGADHHHHHPPGDCWVSVEQTQPHLVDQFRLVFTQLSCTFTD